MKKENNGNLNLAGKHFLYNAILPGGGLHAQSTRAEPPSQTLGKFGNWFKSFLSVIDEAWTR